MYLDPGFGSMIVQVLVASLAGLTAVFFSFKSRILAYLNRRKQKDGIVQEAGSCENTASSDENA